MVMARILQPNSEGASLFIQSSVIKARFLLSKNMHHIHFISGHVFNSLRHTFQSSLINGGRTELSFIIISTHRLHNPILKTLEAYDNYFQAHRAVSSRILDRKKISKPAGADFHVPSSVLLTLSGQSAQEEILRPKMLQLLFKFWNNTVFVFYILYIKVHLSICLILAFHCSLVL